MYQYLCPCLSIYIYTVACHKGGGGGGEVRGIWKDVTSRSTFQNRIISMQKYFRKNFPIAVLSANQDSLNKQLSFFLV